jgi:hypothetical protein
MRRKTMTMELHDEDYTLVDEGMWLTVKGFSIRVHTKNEGVIVDIYVNGREDEDPIAGAYAFDTEVLEETKK